MKRVNFVRAFSLMRIESSLYERRPLSYDSITSTTYFTMSSDEPSRATTSSLGKSRRAFGFSANAKHGIPSKDASAMTCPALSDGSNATIHLAGRRFLKYSAYEYSPHNSPFSFSYPLSVSLSIMELACAHRFCTKKKAAHEFFTTQSCPSRWSSASNMKRSYSGGKYL